LKVNSQSNFGKKISLLDFRKIQNALNSNN